jgi:hypothetical protein
MSMTQHALKGFLHTLDERAAIHAMQWAEILSSSSQTSIGISSGTVDGHLRRHITISQPGACILAFALTLFRFGR